MNKTAVAIELAPSTANGAAAHGVNGKAPAGKSRAVRRRLPDERHSITHRFSVGGHKGYLTVGLYPDGEPGELFITMAKEGSTVSGFVSSFAQVVSVALQHAVPLEVFCDKFMHTRFEPSGFTGNPDIPIASSIMDYVFRWLRLRFLDKQDVHGDVSNMPSPNTKVFGVVAVTDQSDNDTQPSDAPLCRQCGSLTRRNGACFSCGNCGTSTGCG
jgi:ribonucleoside-diphosphate reductase alpha chain